MFTVEDGTGKVDANAYSDVAFADTYFSERGVSTWTGTDAAKKSALIRATDYIDTVFGHRFRGSKFLEEQALCFPRNVAGTLPTPLKRAACEYALRALKAPLVADPVTDSSGLMIKSKSEKLGPIDEKIEYMDQSRRPFKPYPAADVLLRPFLRPVGLVR